MRKRPKLSFWAALLACTGGLALSACGGSNNYQSSSSADSSVSSSASSSSSSSEAPAAHTHRWGDPSWDWHQEGDTFHVHVTFVCLDDSTHVDTVNATVTVESVAYATCTSNGSMTFVATVEHGGTSFSATKTIATQAYGHDLENKWSYDNVNHWHACSHDKTEHFDVAPHTLATRYTSTVQASCQGDVSRDEETYCTVCGVVVSTKRAIVRAINHDYRLVDDECVAPDCVHGGKNVYQCSMCGKKYEQTLNALGHDFGDGPTCTASAKCSRCDATLPALGHEYQKSGHQDASCTQNGYDEYACSRCKDSFQSEIPATGHKLSGNWELDHSEHVEGCQYKDVYKDTCSECQQDVTKETTVTRHTLIAKIAKDATCVAAGEKQYVCKVCNQLDHKEEIPVNPDAHNWNDGVIDGDYMVFTCQNEGCTATKKSFVGHTEAQVEAAVFAEAEEIKMEEAALSFDENSKSQLEGKNLEVKVEKKTADDFGISHEDIPADTPVYDFSLTENGEKAEFDNGEVTVRIPYELQEGDDADALVIYYINDETGELDAFDATYENGYAVFKTSHFSFYYVSYMRPEQACAKLGHKYGESIVVEPTCVSDGYSYEICQRCGGMSQPHDVTHALGHDWVAGSGAADPTCTQPGHSDYKCSRCDAEYGENLQPLGHHYEVAQTIPATCAAAGKIVYECDQCDASEPGHTYEVDFPALGHNYQAVTTPSTCTQEGKIEYICANCGDVDESKTEALATVPHNYEVKSENEEQIVYECSMCHNELTVSKVADPLSKNFNYIQTAKSIAGTDLTIKASDIEFSMLANVSGGQFTFKSSAAEGHIGADASKHVVLYGNADYDFQNLTYTQTNSKGNVAVYLLNSKMYLLMDDGSNKSYQTIDLNSVSMGSDFTVAMFLDKMPELLTYLDEDIRPFIEKILDFNSAKINERVYHLIERFCDYKATPDGYEISLSFQKIAAFANMLKTASIEACVDYALGEGTMEELFSKAEKYIDYNFKAALEYLKADTGIDYKEIIALVDKAVSIFTPYQTLRDYVYAMSNWTVDINDYLSDAFLSGHSIAFLIKEGNVWANLLGDKTLTQYVKNDIRDMMKENLYSLIMDKANVSRSAIEDVQGYIDSYLEALSGQANKIVLVIDRQGNYKSFKVALDFETDQVAIKGNVEFIFNKTYRSFFDYDRLANMGETVMDAIYQANFSSNEKIQAFFGQTAQYQYDASGKIVGVVVENFRSNSAPMYYDGEKYVQSSSIITVTSEKDLFQYANYSYYKQLAALYEQYKNQGTFTLQFGDSYRYNIDSFVPGQIAYRLICGNRYEVNYTISAEYSYAYNALRVAVMGENNQVVYQQTFGNNGSSYRSSYTSGNGVVNLLTKEFENGYSSGHRFVISESVDPDTVACGETVTLKYICADCGLVEDHSYVKGHGNFVADSYEFLTENHNCNAGVIIHGHCEDCGEKADNTVYDHEQAIADHGEVKLEGGAVMVYDKCLCGRLFSYDFEGYIDVNQYVEYGLEDGGWIGGYLFQSLDGNILVDYQSDWDGCLRTDYLVIYEGVANSEKGASYAAVTRYKCGQGESHSLYIDLMSIAKTKDGGYEYVEHCRNCDYSRKTTVAPQSQGDDYYGKPMEYNEYEAYAYFKDMGYPYAPYGFIRVHGTLEQLADGKANDAEIYSEGCLFNHEWLDENHINYRMSCGVSDEETHEACGFVYEVLREKQTLGNCQAVDYIVYRLGVKQDGSAVYEIRQRNGSYTNHNYQAQEQQTIDTDNPYIKIAAIDYVCTNCGASYDSMGLVFSDAALTEDTSVVKDGLTYVYPAGYHMQADAIDGRYYGKSVRVYDAEGHMVREIYNIAEANWNYYSVNNGPTTKEAYLYTSRSVTEYRYYQNQYQFEVSRVSSSSYYYTNRKNSNSYSGSTTFLYPFYEAGAYASAFKDITGYDFDLARYGCYRISVEDGWQRLEQYHIAYEGEGHQCTQPLESHCVVCGDVRYEAPRGHNFSYDSDKGTYVCYHCGTESSNPWNNSVFIEKLGEENGTIVIGFYDREAGMGASLEYLVSRYGSRYASIYAVDEYGGTWEMDVAISDLGDGIHCKLGIATADLAAAAAKMELENLREYRFTIEKNGYYFNLMIPVQAQANA